MLWNFSVVICGDECWHPTELLVNLAGICGSGSSFLKASDSRVLFDVIYDKQLCEEVTEEEHSSFKCLLITFSKLTPEGPGPLVKKRGENYSYCVEKINWFQSQIKFGTPHWQLL